jgi:SAM-dependent methyltransferase
MMSLFSKIKRRDILSHKAVSSQFGFDRGTPIDRYYIRKFLGGHAQDIKGDVLEVGEAAYTNELGKGFASSSVLSFDPSTDGIHGDLTNSATLPENGYDCFICTQTFNFVYDARAAVQGARRLLKPGGVLLATVAALAPVSKHDADRWGDYWRFTPQSCKRLFGDVFSPSSVSVDPYGNSGATALFIKGYALEDLPSSFNLDACDPLCAMVIGVRAVK